MSLTLVIVHACEALYEVELPQLAHVEADIRVQCHANVVLVEVVASDMDGNHMGTNHPCVFEFYGSLSEELAEIEQRDQSAALGRRAGGLALTVKVPAPKGGGGLSMVNGPLCMWRRRMRGQKYGRRVSGIEADVVWRCGHTR